MAKSYREIVRVSWVLAVVIRSSSSAFAAQPAHPSPASQPATSSASTLQAAEAAFLASQFLKATELAAQIRDDDLLAARARYVEGYARYKVGELARAAAVLERSLALAPSPEVSFLAGLVAFELRSWTTALRHLEPIAQEPWLTAAQKLLAQTRSTMAEEQRAKGAVAHARAILRAKAHLQARQLNEARHALAAAEEASPGHLLNHYYRGYLAFEEGDYSSARQHFTNALRVDPADPWSRYMLALSLDDTAPQRTAMLQQLAATGSDATVRAAARAALKRRAQHWPSGLALRLELGAGLDTNPAYATGGTTAFFFGGPRPAFENPAADSNTPGEASSAMALSGELDLSYQRALAAAHSGAVGLHFFEQDYAVGGAGQGKTAVTGWLSYVYSFRRAALAASYDYALYLLGYDPLLSLHELSLKAGVPLRSWLEIGGSAAFRKRDTHDELYQYMDALEIAGAVDLKGQWKALTVRAGYQLARGWSAPVELTIASEAEGPNDPRAVLYHTDYSSVAHGPGLELELALPWQVYFSASIWALWYRFAHPDTFTLDPVQVVIWSALRRDLQILASAELWRPLRYGLEVAVRFGSIDNLSSLDSSMPVNKSYARRTVCGLLRWRWPPR